MKVYFSAFIYQTHRFIVAVDWKMSLYDDLDTKQVPDWSSGINKLLPQPTLNKINKIQPIKKQVKVNICVDWKEAAKQ